MLFRSKFKKGSGEINYNAREFVRGLDLITDDNLFTKGASLGEGMGKLFILTGGMESETVRKSFPERQADHEILSTADVLAEISKN